MLSDRDQEKSISTATKEPNASVDMNQAQKDNIDKSLEAINSNQSGSNGDNQGGNKVTNESEEHKSHSEELSTRKASSIGESGEIISELSDSQKLNTVDKITPQINKEAHESSDTNGLEQTNSADGTGALELCNDKTENVNSLLSKSENCTDVVNDDGKSSEKRVEGIKGENLIGSENDNDRLSAKENEESNTFLTNLAAEEYSEIKAGEFPDKVIETDDSIKKSQENIHESTKENGLVENNTQGDDFYDDPPRETEHSKTSDSKDKEANEIKETVSVDAFDQQTPTDEPDGNTGNTEGIVNLNTLENQIEENQEKVENTKQCESDHSDVKKNTPSTAEQEENKQEKARSEEIEKNFQQSSESDTESVTSSPRSCSKQDDTLADVDPLETITESPQKQETKTGDMESGVIKSEVEKSADDIALADDVSKRRANDDTDNEADDLKSEEIDHSKESNNNEEQTLKDTTPATETKTDDIEAEKDVEVVDNATPRTNTDHAKTEDADVNDENVEKETVSGKPDTDDEQDKRPSEDGKSNGERKFGDVDKLDEENKPDEDDKSEEKGKVGEVDESNEEQKPGDHDKPDEKKPDDDIESHEEKVLGEVEQTDIEKQPGDVVNERTPPREPTPEPEPVKITRNIDVDNAVEIIKNTEGGLKDLLSDMKELLTNYQDRLSSQDLSEFTNDLDKFRGDFESLKDAFKYSEELFNYLNRNLKDMRLLGDDLNSLIQKKFRVEDLTVWMESPEERTEEKEKLKEERIAVEKSAMAKAAEARAAIAHAAVGVTESSLFAAEVEAEAAEAEAIANRAWETAQNAKRDVEEAEKAAVEKRKVEEEARKRAEERAARKAEEERLQREEENKKLHEEAEKKGTSFEDEKRQFEEEKARKEAERKNPKNWPRYIYSVESTTLGEGVPGCIIRAIEGSMSRDDVIVKAVDQLTGTLTLVENEELISNIISITATDPQKKFQFEEPVSVAIPHCLHRNIPGREPVIKQLQPTGKWTELPTNDIVIEDIREMKFVEIRTRRFGVFAVVLKIKKDMLTLIRRGNKVNSTVDARISFTCKPGMLKNNVCFTSEVHTLDVNTVTDLNKRYPTECGSLLSCSPILRFQIPNRKFSKPLTMTLPLPPNSTKQKRPQSVAPGSMNKDKSEPREQPAARPVSSMGFSPKEDEPEEEMHLLVRDDKGPWMVLPKVNLFQPKNKDIVTFDITEPHDRFIILRTKQGISPVSIEKMANHVENAIQHRAMNVVMRQRSDDPNEIVVVCCPASRTDKIITKLGEEGYGEGPPPSKDIIVREGQILDVQFRGNIRCDSERKISLVFNTYIRGRTEFSVEEIDKFAQKSFPFYRGFAQVFTKALVQKPVIVTEKSKTPPKPGTMELVEEGVLLTELLINIPKPEPEPPKPLATAPIRVTAEGPNKEDILQYVASELGDEWKKLAQYLCLKSVRIQAILRQNNQNPEPKKIRYDMLVTWAKRVPRCLNKLEILAQALSACGRGDLAVELRDRDEEFRRRRALAYRDSYLKRAFVKVAQNPDAVKGWKTIANRLGVPEGEVNEIDQSAPSIQQKCYSSLQRWQKSAGDGATLPILSDKLKVCKYRQLARDIETIA